MTPLASKIARDLTVPAKERRFDDRADVLSLFDQEMHCFEVTAISKSVNAVLDDPYNEGDPDAAWDVWYDIGSMLPRVFLPSPVTWLETIFGGSRLACVLHEKGDFIALGMVFDSLKGPFSIHMCDFRSRSILETGDRIEVVMGDLTDTMRAEPSELTRLFGNPNPANPTPRDIKRLTFAKDIMGARIDLLKRELEIGDATIEVAQSVNRFIGMAVLTLDLINTPGLVGLKQHAPHRKLARQFQALGIGRYPLLAWSEIVLKHKTKFAGPDEHFAGATHHKCLHFVRAHLRHYRDGKVVTIPAHWRGDAALGIKRSRYRLAA